MLDRAAIEALVPHAGTMCLIDEVERVDATRIVCVSRQHLSMDNPLRRNGRLSAVHAIEFAAQAAALHGALCLSTHSPPRAGMLVSVRGCRLHVGTLDEAVGALRIEARRTAAAKSLASYEFDVSSQGGRVADGRLGVHTEPA